MFCIHYRVTPNTSVHEWSGHVREKGLSVFKLQSLLNDGCKFASSTHINTPVNSPTKTQRMNRNMNSQTVTVTVPECRQEGGKVNGKELLSNCSFPSCKPRFMIDSILIRI